MTFEENEQIDEATKSYKEILQQKIEQGLTEIQRPVSGLFISGLSAGLDLGFSVFLMGILYTQLKGIAPPQITQMLMASAYPVGFILVIFGRSELFTEHTTLALFPVLGRRASIRALIRTWGVIYFSNLLGAAVFAFLLVIIGDALHIIERETYRELASSLVEHPWEVIVFSGILAGWLMGLVSWLVTAGRETISQIFFVWLITFAIGLGKLHHCIAGSIEIMPSVYLGLGVSFLDYLVTLFWMTLGNAIGGTVFVALIKYSHVIRAKKE